jgi:hypothetical protein
MKNFVEFNCRLEKLSDFGDDPIPDWQQKWYVNRQFPTTAEICDGTWTYVDHRPKEIWPGFRAKP